ncbi:MAG TPA: polysaccharide deacetylase family protein [Pseudomonadota bacterium]|nr:polysaccharide deacetylase family protein [Pseudomonadota bacterium]
MTLRVASVSVDLDPLRCYYEIHGLSPFPTELEEVVMLRAVPRFLDLFAECGISATLFVVGQDALKGRAGHTLLRQAAQDSHELGNHSFSHPYNLSRLSAEAIETELLSCENVLLDLRGTTQGPCGFRAPGYSLSPTLFATLLRLGFRYDSSVFACPPYYLLKLAALSLLALRGQRSGSIVGSPWQQFAPTQPYRPSKTQPHKRGNAPMVELPIAVTKHLRLPAIGTFLLLSSALRRSLLSGMRQQPFFNLELHGMDLLDAKLDEIPSELVAKQPDLRVPLHEKRAALVEIFSFLKTHAQVLPLSHIADRELAKQA